MVETFAKGLCFTYVVVLNIKPLDDNAFTISNNGERFYPLNESANLSEMNYYGFNDRLNYYVYPLIEF